MGSSFSRERGETGVKASASEPCSRAIPRLADFRFGDKTALVSPAVLGVLIQTLESGLFAALGLLIGVIYVDESWVPATPLYLLSTAGGGVLLGIALRLLSLYQVDRMLAPGGRNLIRLAVGPAIALTLLLTVHFFLKINVEFSRVWLAMWFAAGTAVLTFERLILSRILMRLNRMNRLCRRAVIYGAGPDCRRLLAALEADTATDIRISAVFDDRSDDRTSERVLGYPRLGRLADLLSFCRSTRVDLILIALPLSAENRLAQLVDKLDQLPCDIRLVTPSSRLRFTRSTYSFVGNVPFMALADKPIDDWGSFTKSVFDRVVALGLLILFAPLMVLIAIAIKLDSRGPVLFRQKRYGFNNELIEVFKFRSMFTSMSDANADRLVTRHDPRVTRVGRFIRRASIDELPQLFNVLRGELSLVGPRPHALSAKAGGQLYDAVVDRYYARHKVKPGITGWAQIKGWRGETDTQLKIEKRVECDLYYIEHWSLALDTYILLMTPWALMRSENAY